MLYYAGVTKRIGDIDDGDTVMDYLAAERERGITINSAAITFGWQGHRINLIDTPGHVDFTMEVERAVRVLDGAVTILDGVAGVEAQTETVWKQADRYTLPRIAFVNKMDRTGAAFGRTVQEMWKKLRTRPLVLHLPMAATSQQQGIGGVVDIVKMETVVWDPQHEDGSIYHSHPLSTDHPLWEEAVKARTALVEQLAEMEDGIVDAFFDEAQGDHLKVTAASLKTSLRRVTLENKAVPVLCGSAFKNMGVQPVLDAILDYLPSPLERPGALMTLRHGTEVLPLTETGKLCALAFKVTHDPRRGPLVYVKVYSGKLPVRATLYNTTTHHKERANKLLQMYAKEAEEIPAIHAGNIGVVVGLKETCTGDTLVLANDTHAIKSNLQLNTIEIPSPAFFAAIEADSLSEEPAIEEALQHLTREDPSVTTWTDEESGQRLISGMGELHLEIIKDRLLNDFKCKATMGKMRISYRETVQRSATIHTVFDREVVGKRAKAGCQVSLSPSEDKENTLTVVDPEAVLGLLPHLAPTEIEQAIQTGYQSGLSRGALLGFPLAQVQVTLDRIDTFGIDTTLGALSASISNTIHQALTLADPCLLEPRMEVHVQVGEHCIGSVVGDLSGVRRGTILGLYAMEDQTSEDSPIYAPPDTLNYAVGAYRPKQVIKAHVPLSAMLGYSNALRSLTGGSGHFSMRVIGYGVMSKDRERAVVQDMRGA
ncbi:P-loop containing nucleoside triphosphate hydrolase protein [Spinellus fusiger]|nr:P-loop containing nucleoside triphosphate hydrolase protein [Spinellus fusiger]